MDHVLDINDVPVKTEVMLDWYYAETQGLRPSRIRFINGEPLAVYDRPEAGIYGVCPTRPQGWKPTIQQIVADSDWQRLRNILLTAGGWRDQEEKFVTELRIYLGDFKDPFKRRRVLNYLTGSAFRSRTITHAAIEKLLNQLRGIKLECTKAGDVFPG